MDGFVNFREMRSFPPSQWIWGMLFREFWRNERGHRAGRHHLQFLEVDNSSSHSLLSFMASAGRNSGAAWLDISGSLTQPQLDSGWCAAVRGPHSWAAAVPRISLLELGTPDAFPVWGWLGLPHSVAASDFLEVARSSRNKRAEREPGGSCIAVSNLILEVTRRLLHSLRSKPPRAAHSNSPLTKRMSES